MQYPNVSVISLESRPRDFFCTSFRRFLGQQIAEGINFIHSHHTSILGSVAPWLWSHPRVALLASRYVMCERDKHDPLNRLIYGRVDALLVTSESLRRNVVFTHPMKERRVKVVAPGVDLARFDPSRGGVEERRAAWGVDSGTAIIGTVGRFHSSNGQDVFLKAAAGLLKEHLAGKKFEVPPLKFVVVGEPASEGGVSALDELRSMVRQFRIEEYVIFEPYNDRIAQTIQAFDIFVQPRLREGLGLAALEAMAMERAVVLSDSGSFKEWVRSEEFGVTFRPGDAFDLQRRLRALAANPVLRTEMGRLARAHVLQHYDREARIQRKLEIYERCFRVRQSI
jgi:glycosyltransferase involved in cell wall biosynthesis